MSLAETIEGPNSALEAMPALLLAEILYARNSCEEAAELIARFGREAEKKGFVDHLAAYYTVRAALEFRAGDVEAARETLLLGRQSAERHGFERLRRRVENEGLRQSFIEGDLSKARSIRAEGLADGAKLKPRPGSTSGDETWALTWSRAACAMGDGAAASRVLKLWVAFARDRGAARSEVRFLIALSICLTLSGRDGEAARCMREAVSKATGPRYIRYFIDEGQAAETVLRSLFSDEDEVNDPVETFGRELLAAFTSEAKQWPQRDMGAVPTAREEETITPIEPLNTREREVLSLVGVGLSNKEIARRLGLAEASVKWHLQQVFTKLDVRRRIGAVRRAQKFGML